MATSFKCENLQNCLIILVHHVFRLPLHILILIILLIHFDGSQVYGTREASPHSKFLYNTAETQLFITDYQIHLAPSGDYSGKEQEEHAKYHPGHKNDEERHVRPSFLNPIKSSTINRQVHGHNKPHNKHHGNRVVQFYSPWSGKSQNYVERFTTLAKDIYVLQNPDYDMTDPNNFHMDEDKDSEIDNANDNDVDVDGDGDVDVDEIKFYTVSCSAHHWVCQDHGIKSYPTVIAYRKNSVNPIQFENWETLSVEDLLQFFHLKSKYFNRNRTNSTNNQNKGPHEINEKNGNENDEIDMKRKENKKSGIRSSKSSSKKGSKSKMVYETEEFDPANAFMTVDVLGASAHVYQRVKKETYADAAISFTYALRHDIYRSSPSSNSMENSDKGPFLTPEQKIAFSEWIDLLYWTLPPNWRLHTLINDIRSNIETSIESKAALIDLVDLHHDVVHEGHEFQNPLDTTNNDKDMSINHENHVNWSPACAKAKSPYDIRYAYTCGLWNLMHIVSIGVAERHLTVLGARERASLPHAMHTVSQYLKHFTSLLDDTAETGISSIAYFREQTSKCIDNPYIHCANLYTRTASKNNKNKKEWEWKQMALYFWELHNNHHVNEWKELIKKKKGYVPHNMQEAKIVMWPDRELCDACHKDNHYGGGWNLDMIYDFLKSEYWCVL